MKIFQPQKENFRIKNSYIFHISDQNIDYEYTLGFYMSLAWPAVVQLLVFHLLWHTV